MEKQEFNTNYYYLKNWKCIKEILKLFFFVHSISKFVKIYIKNKSTFIFQIFTQNKSYNLLILRKKYFTYKDTKYFKCIESHIKFFNFQKI